MSKGFTSSPRIALLAGAILLSFAGLAVRLVSLHVLDRDVLMKFVVKARRQIIVDNAKRGDIYDAHGRILATSRTQVVLGVDPQAVRAEDEAKWPELARLTGLPLPELRAILTTRTRKVGPRKPDAVGPAAIVVDTAAKADDAKPVPDAVPTPTPAGALVFNLTLPSATSETSGPAAEGEEGDDTVLDDTADANGYRLIQWAKLSDHVDEATNDKIMALGIKGIYGSRVFRRAYPHDGLAAHVIGYVNKAGEPATGVEAYADFYLRGRNGWREGERDGRGRELAQFRSREVPRADGYNVKLSIDSNVQSIIEDELAAITGKYQPLKATIIVSDPKTGFILGLANYPSYNLSDYGKADISAQRNVAVADQYEPGSVFKIVAASGALEEGMVTPSSRYDCSIDRIEYKGKVRSLPPEDHIFENPRSVSLAEIISYSSNRGAVQLAMQIGEDDFCRYASKFGFGQRTGFPFGGEISGTMHTPGSAGWDGQTITRMPMGHSVSVTVMQMHQAMGVIASGGVLLQPQIIGQITDPAGEIISRYQPIEVRRVISQRTAQTMAGLLMGVASPHGTAPEAAIPNFQVAGKTGTTQKVVDGKYSDRHHVASFVGFFPASRPQIEISVIVDDADAHVPGGVAYGAKVAAPAFKHIGEQLIQYYNIKPVYESEPGRGMLVMEGGRQ
jgi:cell division protein FtsI (penicillin-binding protein 3)